MRDALEFQRQINIGPEPAAEIRISAMRRAPQIIGAEPRVRSGKSRTSARTDAGYLCRRQLIRA